MSRYKRLEQIKGRDEFKIALDKFLKENKINVDYNDLNYGLPSIMLNIIESFDPREFSAGL
jgi:hypothetical protein